MLDVLKSLLSDLGEGTKPQGEFGDNDYRLAAAALLIHVVNIDGQASAAEFDRLRTVLQSQFGLSDVQVRELIEVATTADREAVDLYRFTSILVRSLDEDGRRKIVEMMWEIVFADGRRTEFEDNVVWRAADLLGISTRDRVELRRRIAAEQ
jgi:uncharacterized tellurite resistance protein B-like protein